jgi:DNA-binding MarR family transcriptional regulator
MKPTTEPAEAGYLIKEVQHLMRRRMDQALGHLSITTPQFAVLTWLQRTPGLSNAELAHHCFVTPQTMNLIVKKLEDRGLVVRSESPSHGKILPFALTSEGTHALQQAQTSLAGVERGLFGVLSTAELKSLVSTLRKLRATEPEGSGSDSGTSAKRRAAASPRRRRRERPATSFLDDASPQDPPMGRTHVEKSPTTNLATESHSRSRARAAWSSGR